MPKTWTIEDLAQKANVDIEQARRLIVDEQLYTVSLLATAAGTGEQYIRGMLQQGQYSKRPNNPWGKGGFKIARDWAIRRDWADKWLAKRGVKII